MSASGVTAFPIITDVFPPRGLGKSLGLEQLGTRRLPLPLPANFSRLLSARTLKELLGVVRVEARSVFVEARLDAVLGAPPSFLVTVALDALAGSFASVTVMLGFSELAFAMTL